MLWGMPHTPGQTHAQIIALDAEGNFVQPTVDLSPLKVDDEFWHYAVRCAVCGRMQYGTVPRTYTFEHFLESCRDTMVGFKACPVCEVMTIHELIAASPEPKVEP